jgi:hypothetical protein
MVVENIVHMDEIETDEHHIPMLIIVIKEVWVSSSSKKEV